MKAKHLPLFVLLAISFLSAACKESANANSLTLASYNLQTFFDAVEDGTEYREFKGNKSKWSEDAYKERLVRLCRVMKAIDADVYAFMEVENEGVIQDICNTFPLIQWGKNAWHYACFDKGRDGAFGCALMSKYPLSCLTVHSIDIRTSGAKQPPLRNIMCVRVEAGTGITVIVNHWKSKAGGEEESEYWRNWQEGVLASLFLENADKPTVACGDFNLDISSFDGDGRLVRLHGIAGGKDAIVTSAWSIADEAARADSKAEGSPGSYYYKNKWERIDLIFSNTLVSIDSFAALGKGEWAAEDGKPLRYNIRSRTGYSDHLPVMAAIHW